MRRLAQIALQSLKEGRYISTLLEGEVFPRDASIPGGVAKVELLSGDCSRNVDPGLDILFCDSHVVVVLGWILCAEQVFDRRSAVEFYRSLVVLHGLVNLDGSE